MSNIKRKIKKLPDDKNKKYTYNEMIAEANKRADAKAMKILSRRVMEVGTVMKRLSLIVLNDTFNFDGESLKKFEEEFDKYCADFGVEFDWDDMTEFLKTVYPTGKNN